MKKHSKEENRLFAVVMFILVLVALFGEIEIKDEEFYTADITDSIRALIIGDSTWSDTLKEVKNDQNELK
jgi:hypothetical protein